MTHVYLCVFSKSLTEPPPLRITNLQCFQVSVSQPYLSNSHRCFLSSLNWILSSFCCCLVFLVGVNFLHLFLGCYTLLSRWDDLNANKWHMISCAFLPLTAYVKWRSVAVSKAGFCFLSYAFFLLVLFLYGCVSLFHRGPGTSFTSVVHIKSTGRKMCGRGVQTTLASPETIIIEVPLCKAFTVSGDKKWNIFG